ncbi:MAG TPA: tetratricopeptide repeat protein [Terriglobales bacterium]|nr:tetratricopeptide repeat protein [Terriglobales bacterium]
MNCRIFASPLLVVVLTMGLAAQSKPGGSGPGRTPGSSSTNTRTPSPNVPATTTTPSPLDTRGPTFLSGKVVVDDGTPLTDAALIQSICRGRIRAEGYTDRKGAFSVDLSNNARQMVVTAEENDAGFPAALAAPRSGPNAGMAHRDMRDCDLQAVLPGFTSQSVELASKVNEFGNADVGVIVLHRMKQVEGFTISATSALAPGKAAKQYEKGRDDEKKGKWSAAQAEFSKAVEVYPKYAVAWLELGRTQLQMNDPAAAKASFQQSLAADPKFISPGEELAQLALKEKQWKELADRTEQLLKLNPMSFPQYYYYSALADYFLQSFDQAEKTAAQGLSIDPQHRVPKLEYLLGMVLAQKHDYAAAAVHVRNYIQLLPNADDVATAQKQLAELDRLSASAADQKK